METRKSITGVYYKNMNVVSNCQFFKGEDKNNKIKNTQKRDYSNYISNNNNHIINISRSSNIISYR